MQNYLIHYGVPRRSGRYPWGSGKDPYQSLPASERNSIKNGVLFVSGSSKTQDPTSQYYREKLPKNVTDQIDHAITYNKKIVVGDAPGIDRQVQDYLNEKGYGNVEIYGPGKQVRYTANKNWKTNPIDDPDHEPGSKEWLAKKDKAMSDVATEGLAVVLDDGAKATRKNVERLVNANKDVYVHVLDSRGPEKDIPFIGKAFVDKIMNPRPKEEIESRIEELRSIKKNFGDPNKLSDSDFYGTYTNVLDELTDLELELKNVK